MLHEVNESAEDNLGPGLGVAGFTDTANLTVLTPAESELDNLDIDGQGDNATVEEGETGNVSADITNIGEADGAFDVELNVSNGETLTVTETVPVAGGETETLTVEDVTAELDPDTYDVTVSTDDDELTGTLTVEEDDPAPRVVGGGGFAVTEPDPAFFEVSELDPVDVTVDQGDSIDVSATITNTGEQGAQQIIEFRVDDTVLAEESIVLTSDGGEQTVTFENIDTSELAAGSYTHGVFTENDSQTGTLTVDGVEEPEAVFEVSELDPVDETVEQGDAIDVSATITNTGDADGSQTVELRIDGETTATESVELAAGADQTVTFSDVVIDEPSGAVEHGVFTDDDSQTGTLTVEPVEESTPGFGVIVALIALIAAALIAASRRP